MTTPGLAPGRAEAGLGLTGGVGVVDDRDRAAGHLAEHLGGVDVDPRRVHVGRGVDVAALGDPGERAADRTVPLEVLGDRRRPSGRRSSGVAGSGVSSRRRSVISRPFLVSTTAPLMPVPPMSMPSAFMGDHLSIRDSGQSSTSGSRAGPRALPHRAPTAVPSMTWVTESLWPTRSRCRPRTGTSSTTAGCSATSAPAPASCTTASGACASCGAGPATRWCSPATGAPAGTASTRSRRSRSTTSSRAPRCSASAPPGATWPAASARTGTSPSPRRSTGSPTRRRRRPSPTAALELGCASVAFTYNDPVVFLEYAVDTAEACREVGVRSVAVSAGYVVRPAPPRALRRGRRRQHRPQGLHRRVLPPPGHGRPGAGARHPRAHPPRHRRLAGDHDAAHPRRQRLRRRARRHDPLDRRAPRRRRPPALQRLPPRLPHARRPAHPGVHAHPGPADRHGQRAALRLHRQRPRPRGRHHPLPVVRRGGHRARLVRPQGLATHRRRPLPLVRCTPSPGVYDGPPGEWGARRVPVELKSGKVRRR